MADYILNYVFIRAESVFSEGSQPGNGSILEHTEEMLVPVESGFYPHLVLTQVWRGGWIQSGCVAITIPRREYLIHDRTS